MSPGEKLAYQLARPAVEADEIIRQSGGSLSAEQFHELTLLATGSKAAAERAFLAKRGAELRSGRPVAE